MQRLPSLVSLSVLLAGGSIACSESAPSAPPKEPPKASATEGEQPKEAGAPAEGAGAEETPDASAAAPVEPGAVGKIRGVALYEGTPPARAPLAIAGTAGCTGHTTPPLNERIIVTDGKVANVFVYVSRGLEDWTAPEASTEPVIVDQIGCLFVPHVSSARVGQPVLVGNRDGIAHNVNVKSASGRNPGDNKTQAPGSPAMSFTFGYPDVPVSISCDIHPWMRAYVCVQPHPFHAITKEDGSFVIEGLPPGKYTISTWHEAFKTQREELVVPAGGEATAEFHFSGN
jgi:plastocyanin